MTIKLVKIGNSKGIRLPKALIDACNLEGEVELEIQGTSLVIRAVSQKRKDWSASFEMMAKNEDDKIIDQNNISSSWDEDEWQW